MSRTAVALCISLLSFLILVIAVAYPINRNRVKAIPRDVDTLASTLAYVHGSERLLNWVQQEAPVALPWYRAFFASRPDMNVEHLKARLGPFVSADGKQRWGVELLEPKNVADDSAPMLMDEGIELHSMAEASRDGDSDIALQTPHLELLGWEPVGRRTSRE
ncbi:unnamed protein product [Aureobasidium mustum]|uniref:Uncharacterized protein n=1 Tax=Aureobasidium mustum TaxID=2773714 RepID=A0A9N8JC54_9PEZI|nr:unnamed protein product [Aureobasidium mustum]